MYADNHGCADDVDMYLNRNQASRPINGLLLSSQRKSGVNIDDTDTKEHKDISLET